MTGKAYLIGAGPGRPDLITVRGLYFLRRAEVLLYDRLIPQELLTEASTQAERIFVGKGLDRHVMAQEDIIALMIKQVQAGKQVVRLKGGDPFVFGRGGEEILALAERGLPFEVIPGVSSAIAVPAYAGIPVTHRGLSTAFAVVTGHEAPGKLRSQTDWAALAQIATLVVLMATRRLRDICQVLLTHDRAPDTPATVISWGTTNQQKVLKGTLTTLPQLAQTQPVPTPAILVIGEVADLADQLTWFEPDGEAVGFIPLSEI